MPQPPRKTILEQGIAQAKAPLQADDLAVLSSGVDEKKLRVEGAIDLGDNFEAGGYVERQHVDGWRNGWGFFAGLTKRWKKN